MPPFPMLSNEEQRIEQLAHYELRDLRKSSELDVFVESACLIADCPAGLVAIMDSDKQYVQACMGLELDELPREDTICQYTVLSPEILVIPDTLEDVRSSSNALVLEAGIRFYVGVPLVNDSGFVIGTICLVDYKPKAISNKQINALKQLAAGVTKIYLSYKNDSQSEYFTDLFYTTQNIICVLDEQGKMKNVNPSFESLFECSKVEVLGKDFSEFISIDKQVNFDLLSLEKESISFSDEFLANDHRIINIDWLIKRYSNKGEIFCFGRNVTAEQEEKVKLENSERKFRNFFENSIGLVSMHDLSGNILSVNKKGREVLGYSAKEVNSVNLRDLMSANHEGNIDKYLERIAENKEDSGLMVLADKEGNDTFWLYHNLLETDNDGAEYVVSTALNMTERMLLEKDLLQTKQLLEHTSEVAEVGGWELNLEENKLYWSETTRKIHQVDSSYEPNIYSASEFYEPIYSQPKIISAFEKAVKEGIPYDLELEMIQKSGEKIWVRAKGVAEFENDKCKRVYGIIQNINESKKLYLELDKQKSMLQYFVTDVPACVAMFDYNLNCIIVSDQWKEENIEGDIPVIGKHLFELFPEVPEHRRKRYQDALLGIPYKCMDEVLSIPKFKEPQHFNWEIRPWRLGNGEIGGIVIFTQNITHLVKANEDFKIAKRNADLANKAKTEFLANMSHEIRTPLNGVIGFSDLLLKTPLNDLQKQYLNYINESGNSLLNIINDILDFSKIESGKLELYITKYNIFDLANQVINVVLYQAQSKGIELLLNIDQNLPTYIWCDDVRIKQVLINLLSNAVKFTEKGEIELSIALVERNDKEVHLKFSVRDTGIGIPEEKQDRIFDAFTQEDSSVSKRYGGTGLGLTISNNILKYMGSNLNVVSEIGYGSTFSFDLAVSYEFEAAPENDLLEQVRKIMVVDDNENNRIILEKMLAFKNIEVHMAANGMEALNMLMQDVDYDIIMVDYFMPILTGVETIEKIKSIFESKDIEVPLIILHTSSEDHEVKQKLQSHGDFLSLLKPIRSQALYDTLRNALLNKQQDKVVKIEEKAAEENIMRDIHILIADDNPVNMALNTRMMNNLLPNAILYEVVNGKEAIEYCTDYTIDMILMDVQMPEVDGLEATRQIRQMPAYKDVPIIGVTAGNIKGEREKCLEAGMSDFLAKPIKQDQLQNVIKDFITATDDCVDESLLHIDFTVINEHTGDDANFKKYFLELVLQELQVKVDELQSAYEADNQDEILRLLHKLKGTSSTSGLQKLNEQTVALEAKLKNNEPVNHLKYIEIYTEIEYLIKKIKTLIK